MTDLNNDGIPDRDQGMGDGMSPGAGSFSGPDDSFSRFRNDPGVRRGFRIAGRFAVGYLVAASIFFVVVLVFIIVVASKVLSST